MKFRLLAAVILVSLAYACNSSKSDDPKTRLEELRKQQAALTTEIKKLEAELEASGDIKVASKTVAVTTLATGEFKTYIDVQGRVDARENVDVSAESMGVVRSILVRSGDQVKKDQVLAELDQKLIKKSIDQVKTQLNLATTLFNKQEALWKQKIGSEVQYLSAKAQKEGLEQNLAALNEQLNMSRVKSPIDGVVDEVNLKIGQAVQPGIPLVRVINYNDLRVVADLAESNIAKVKSGDKVKVLFKDLNKEIDANVSYAAKAINPMTRTFRVEVKITANQRDYYPNMISQVRINDYTNPAALIIPINIVQKSEMGDFVFVAVKNGKKYTAEKRTITTGRTYGASTEVVSGLQAGDQVISTGYNDLNEGQVINF